MNKKLLSIEKLRCFLDARELLREDSKLDSIKESEARKRLKNETSSELKDSKTKPKLKLINSRSL